MAIQQTLIHKAILESSNILDDDIASNYHAEETPQSKLFDDPDHIRAMHRKGNYCMSFMFWRNGDGLDTKPQKCVRIWYSNAIIDYERFRLISGELSKISLPYFTKFEYKKEGVIIAGQKHPAIFMDWIDGHTLTEWLPANRNNPQKISKIANEFKQMVLKFNSIGIAHGDLCNENILVTNNEKIKLVDYDSIYVPLMENRYKAVTAGWDDFQHPKRINNEYTSQFDDYFSQHLIYLCLLVYAKFPQLIPEKAEKVLLFGNAHFQNEKAFVDSKEYGYVNQRCQRGNIQDDIILDELEILRKSIAGNWREIPPLKYSQSQQTPQPQSPPIGTGNPPSSTGQAPSLTNSHPIPPAPTAQIGTPWYKQWYTWVGAAILMAFLYFTFVKDDNNNDNGSVAKTELNASAAIGRIEGNYTLREKNAGVLVNGIRTAAIKKTSETQARILVVSEYEPEIYEFSLDASGSIESEQLGKGKITYNEKLDKITLTFKQGERICELTK